MCPFPPSLSISALYLHFRSLSISSFSLHFLILFHFLTAGCQAAAGCDSLPLKGKEQNCNFSKTCYFYFAIFFFLFSPGLKLLMRVAGWVVQSAGGQKLFQKLFSFVRSATDLLRSLQFQELFWWGGTCGLSEISKSCDIPKSSRFIATLIFTAPTNFPRHTSGLKNWIKKIATTKS